jgi:polyketide biosynthesis enoyl-CoA hydratase PksH
MTTYETIKVRFQDTICFVQLYRPEAENTINQHFVEEYHHVLKLCEETATVVILEGLPEVFCFGADFAEMHEQIKSGQQLKHDPGPLYDLWLQM